MEVLSYHEEKFHIKDGFVIAAKVWGDPSGKPVLAIHGWLDNANTFDKIAPLISEGLYLIAIDLPGHGLSDHLEPDNYYYLWDYAKDILQLTDALQWNKFSILAHSMGTGIATIMAGAFPQKVDQLIFIDGLGAPFVVNETEIISNFQKSIKQLKVAKKTNFFSFQDTGDPKFITKEEAILNRMNNSIGKISYEASKILMQRSLKSIEGGYKWRFDPLIMLTKPFRLTEKQAKLFINHITCKTLIILGNEGMFATGLFKERINEFQNATIHWLQGNHHLHLEEAHQHISILINQFINNK